MKSFLRSSILLLLAASALRSDEGMWTFDNVPVKKMQAKHGFAPDHAWLKKLQLATIAFPGGTGAFVSPEGLVITNHHVGRGYIQQLSTATADLIKGGFTAATRDQEIRVPGLELKVLRSMENITARVNTEVKPGMSEVEAQKARRNTLSRIRKEEELRTGLVCEPVTLYHGGEYWIYRYQKFSDVRLVAAPEMQVADYGGDDDNYTYPRWSLDFALFRIYEAGKPYRPEAFLPFTTTPLKAGHLTLISGSPGTTYRQQTLAQMTYARDFGIPTRIRGWQREKKALEAFATTSEEARRISAVPLNAIGNYLKRFMGQLQGLQRPANLQKVAEAEASMKAAVAKDPGLHARVGGSWAAIEKALQRQQVLLKETSLIDNRNSALLGHALTLVRLFEEEAKPSDKRLTEFSEGSLKTTRGRLLNPAPIPKSLDEVRFTAGLREALEELGPEHPFVKAMLDGRSPETVAKAALEGTQIHEVAFRKQLMEGGKAALEGSRDPLILLARKLDPFNRAARKNQEEQVTGLINEHGSRLAEARFAILGKESYPDGTSTLRLSYGPVATYATGSGTRAQPFTTFLGLYDRHLGWGGNEAGVGDEAWKLPQRWLDRKERLNLSVPFNFIYNCDTVGGNSGSPVVNAKGEFIGINFDSVFEGQGGYYVYDADTKRAVALDARAILESLRKIMDGEHLVKELGAK